MRIYPRVSIIILNWNGWKDTIECLESLYKIEYPNFEIIVVDNNSINDSIKNIIKWTKTRRIKCFYITKNDLDNKKYLLRKIKANHLPSREKLIIIANDKNYGFAEGNNIAIEQITSEGQSDYVLLLNNDTTVKSDFLKYLVNESKKDKNVTIAGPKIFYYSYNDRKDIIWFGGGLIDWRRYPGYFYKGYNLPDNQYGIQSDTIESEWITGACMLIKINKTSLIEGKMLNSEFYFGGEDIDFSLRVKKNGGKIILVPNAVIWHKVGRSRPMSIKQVFNSTKTNFKLIKRYNNSFFIDLPKYLIRIPFRYIQLIIYKLRTKQ